jgi:hypothetical protein
MCPAPGTRHQGHDRRLPAIAAATARVRPAARGHTQPALTSCAARRGLRQSRRETAAGSQDRDDLIGQRDTARAHTARTLGNGAQRSDSHRDAGDSRWSGLRLFGHQFAGRPAVVEPPESVTGEPASDEHVGVPAPAEQLPNGSHP